MGSPLSAPIANLVMEDLEDAILSDKEINVSCYRRFEDDIFLTCNKGNLMNIIEKFNKYHEKIKFTHEVELDNKLPFLDLMIYRDSTNGNLTTKWYTKPTWTKRYMNFWSNAPLQNKIAVVYGLVDRALLLSDPAYQKDSLNKIKEALQSNNYPISFINKYIKKRKMILKAKREGTVPYNDNSKPYISIPYSERTSTKIGTMISQKIKVNICYKRTNNLSYLFTKLKSTLPKGLHSNVIYKIQCEDCEGKYVGQTRNYLRDRINSHKRAIQKGSHETALSKHSINNLHKFDFENVKILAHESNTKKRLFKEIAWIKKTEKSVNNNEDIGSLSTLYSGII